MQIFCFRHMYHEHVEFSPMLIEFFFDLWVVVRCELSLVRWLLVSMNWDKRFRIDDKLYELISTGDAPKMTIGSAHDSSVCELLSVGTEV